MPLYSPPKMRLTEIPSIGLSVNIYQGTDSAALKEAAS